MPGPRRAQGFIGPLFQRLFTWPYRWALRALYRAGLRPWELTLLSLATNVVIGWLLVRSERFLPGMLLIVAVQSKEDFGKWVAQQQAPASR